MVNPVAPMRSLRPTAPLRGRTLTARADPRNTVVAALAGLTVVATTARSLMPSRLPIVIGELRFPAASALRLPRLSPSSVMVTGAFGREPCAGQGQLVEARGSSSSNR